MGVQLPNCRRSYLQACLLLLIYECPDHGYDLTTRLASFGLSDGDAPSTYRALRGLEREGAIESTWAPSPEGPARRIYRLTRSGRDALTACGAEFQREQRLVTDYLRRLEAIAPGRRPTSTAPDWYRPSGVRR